MESFEGHLTAKVREKNQIQSFWKLKKANQVLICQNVYLAWKLLMQLQCEENPQSFVWSGRLLTACNGTTYLPR